MLTDCVAIRTLGEKTDEVEKRFNKESSKQWQFYLNLFYDIGSHNEPSFLYSTLSLIMINIY